MKKRFAVFSILIIFVLSVPVYAGVPMTTVQATVNRVLDVLRDPKLKSPAAKEIKKEKLRIIYKDMFDEIEFSKRTLTRNWNKFNPAQHKEFVNLFEQVLEKSYIDKILDYRMKKSSSIKKTCFPRIRLRFRRRLLLPPKKSPFFTG